MGGLQASLKLTGAGATELAKLGKLKNGTTAQQVRGLLFDPIRVFDETDGSTRAIGDDIIKYIKSTSGDPGTITRIQTKDVISAANYNSLISDGPYKTTTTNQEPYWACACNDSFGDGPDNESSGFCSVNSNGDRVSWGICESHADQNSCQEDQDAKCTFHSPTRIFRPPDNLKSCQTDLCPNGATIYQPKNLPRIVTRDVFSIDENLVSKIEESGEPDYPYCACNNEGWPNNVELCQTSKQTIIPYGRRKGLIGTNPCHARAAEGQEIAAIPYKNR